MDEDMERRIESARKKKGEQVSRTAANIDTYNYASSKAKTRSYEQEMTKLDVLKNKLSPVFSSWKALELKAASQFSIKTGTLKKPGYTCQDDNNLGRYKKPQKIDDLFLILKLDSLSGLAVNVDSSNTYHVSRIARDIARRLPADSHPLFKGAWVQYSKIGKFCTPEETEDFLREEIASSVVENEKYYDERFERRVIKLCVAAGICATFLWASGAIGEEYSPANDLSPFEPDRDVPTLSVDMK